MSFVTAVFVRRISIAQREELIRHVASNQPFIVAARGDDGRMPTVRRLIELNLLKGDDRVRPRHTYLTDAGRECVAMILADYADALVAAGCLTERVRPIDLVDLIKSESDRRKLLPPPPGKDYDRHRRG